MPHSPLERVKIQDWNQTIDVNIKGVLRTTIISPRRDSDGAAEQHH
jgi:NADP-dependent 3-hydroxy acid dehydrogenase YdfG